MMICDSLALCDIHVQFGYDFVSSHTISPYAEKYSHNMCDRKRIVPYGWFIEWFTCWFTKWEHLWSIGKLCNRIKKAPHFKPLIRDGSHTNPSTEVENISIITEDELNGSMSRHRPVDAVSSGGYVLVVEEHASALESGDADVCLPRELAERGLVAADDPLLQWLGAQRLHATHEPRLGPQIRMIDLPVQLQVPLNPLKK